MCWKTSSPPPEPSPAPMLLSSTLSAITEAVQFNATEVSGGSMCPHSTSPCNSTAIECFNEGIICCIQHSEEPICICQPGYEPPDCLFHDIPEIGLSVYNENSGGKIGLIVFVLAVVLLITIALVVILRRKLIIRRQNRNSSNVEQLTELPDIPVGLKKTDSCSNSLLNSHYSSKAEG